MRRYLIFFILPFLMLSCMTVPPSEPGVTDLRTFRSVGAGSWVIGHRGAGGVAPENTLAALRAANFAGADAVEIDIQRTRDGKLVLLHDVTLNRTTDGTGLVFSRDWEEVKVLDAGGSFSREFAGEKVPSLDEALAYIRTTPMVPCIEVKKPGLYPGIARDLIASLDRYGIRHKAVILSFNYPFLRRLEKFDSQIQTIFLSMMPQSPEGLGGLDGCSLYYQSLRFAPGTLTALRRAGKRVFIWGTDRSRIHRWFWDRQIDGITTDFPRQTGIQFVNYYRSRPEPPGTEVSFREKKRESL